MRQGWLPYEEDGTNNMGILLLHDNQMGGGLILQQQLLIIIWGVQYNKDIITQQWNSEEEWQMVVHDNQMWEGLRVDTWQPNVLGRRLETTTVKGILKSNL